MPDVTKPGGMTTEEGLLWEIMMLVKQISITGGGVTSITATSPITITPGATPVISTSMATNKLLGRATAATGVMEEITLGTGLSFAGTTLNVTGFGTGDIEADGSVNFTGIETFEASLKIMNPAHTFSYTLVPSAIAADRNLTIPLLTADDTLATLGLAQTITGAKTFTNGALLLRNPANTSSYTITPAAIVADRVLTLPLTVASDTLCAVGIDNQMTTQVIVGNIACTVQGRFTGNNASASVNYRLTNGGSNVVAQLLAGSGANSAGNLAVAFDSTNMIVLAHNNGTRLIAGAAWSLAALDNTAGSEDSDLVALTQSAGGAMTQKFRISNLGNIVCGAEAALATTATDGDLYIPSCAGLPTGVPTGYTGKIALRGDSTNGRIYAYVLGAWAALN